MEDLELENIFNNVYLSFPHCNNTFLRKYNLQRHIKSQHLTIKPIRRNFTRKTMNTTSKVIQNEDLNTAIKVLKKVKAQDTTTPEKLE